MDAAAAFRALRTAEGRRDPFPFYAALHAHGPVLALDPPVGRTAAVVHGYDAVTAVLRDPVFRVPDSDRLSAVKPAWPEHPALVVFMNSMMFSNGDRHARSRRLVTQYFTVRRVNSLATAIATLVADLLDRIADLGVAGRAVDFMTEFAYPLPSNVIGELLGVPAGDRAWFRPQVIAIGGVLDGHDPQKLAAADEAARQLNGYFADLIARRRVEPEDDLVSILARAWEDEPGLDETQLLSTLVLLFNAGFETTTHLLGNGMSILLDHPGSVRLLHDDPGLAAAFVEEFLRMEAPAQFTTRWASRDTEVGGVPVPAGREVLVFLGAANRDPRRFAAPDAFDPWRPGNHPLTFSTGPHFCSGAALTRLEGRIAFSALAGRFPAVRPAGPSTRLDQLALRGHTSLPVCLR